MARSDTLSNLDRLNHISRTRERAPLNAAQEDYESDELDKPDKFDDKIQLLEAPHELYASLRRRHLTLEIENLDKELVRSIFGILASNNRRRVPLRHGKGFKLVFEDLTTKPQRHSIIDSPEVRGLSFYGFYIWMWLSTGFLILKNLSHAVLENHLTVFEAPVFKIFTAGLPTIFFTDVLMYFSIYPAYMLQYCCMHGFVRWYTTGWIIQALYEVFFFCFWLFFCLEYVINPQWIGKVFLVLHMLVLLMKMHSYAFYNGYLWSVLHELQFAETHLRKLQTKVAHVPEGYTEESTKKLVLQLIAFCKFELLQQSYALRDDMPDEERNKILDMSLETLQHRDLVKFPYNLTLGNFLMYTMYPTVVYELVHARKERIRWKYVFEKVSAIFGVIFLMLVVAEDSIYPLVMKSRVIRFSSPTPQDKVVSFLLLLVDMIPPFMAEYMLVFFLIWEAILNAIGELSKYADRDFYGPWWLCTDWFEYARLWNKPVHRFLLRHVYHSSISAFSLNKKQANMVTFVISSLVHELVMYVIFGRLRGYLLVFQMSQIPLVMFSRTRFMRDKKVLGNVICWTGFITGPAIICCLYLVF